MIVHTYRCDICGLQKRESNNWFAIYACGAPPKFEAAPFSGSNEKIPGILHCCGIECLMKGVGRWASGASISGGSDQAA
jgi:hypothetical protein